jgi:two-component system, NtrC family, response regulator AtoC
VAGESAAVTIRFGTLPSEEAILGTSSAMGEVRDKFQKIACTDVPLLIRGEAGTGKEILARLIHKRYPGEATPFHKVTPAGREGWRRSASYVLPHDGSNGNNGNGHHLNDVSGKLSCIGTLFFDDVAELNSISQRNLMHLIHDDRPPGLGRSEYAPPLFRVICSSRHDIEQAMSIGNFREDLFYSINIVSLNLPPLRARREDIPGLVHYFWKCYLGEFGSDTPEPASFLLAALQEHDWPGNIRELATVVKRYVLLGSGEKIIQELTSKGCLPPACKTPSVRGISLKSLSRQEAREVERKIIFKTLRETQWNRKRAARALNISYRTLLYKIKEAGVPPKRILVKREKQN